MAKKQTIQEIALGLVKPEVQEAPIDKHYMLLQRFTMKELEDIDTTYFGVEPAPQAPTNQLIASIFSPKQKQNRRIQLINKIADGMTFEVICTYASAHKIKCEDLVSK